MIAPSLTDHENGRREGLEQARPKRWRHKKRGTTYVEVDDADLQCERPISDYAVVKVYRAEHDRRLWVRPLAEFEDGRFEEIVDDGALRTSPPTTDPLQAEIKALREALEPFSDEERRVALLSAPADAADYVCVRREDVAAADRAYRASLARTAPTGKEGA